MKRLLCGLLAVMMLLPTSVLATEDAEEVKVAAPAEAAEMLDCDELFAAYVESVFYGGGISLYSTGMRSAYSQLETEAEKELFMKLKADIDQLLAGIITSTVFQIQLNNPLDINFWSDQIGNVISAIMLDCPMEMFWYDKTAGCSMGLTGTTSVRMSMCVAAAYSATGGTDSTTVSNKVSAAKTAAENARTVVEQHEGKADYEKLLAYRDYICNAVSYNTAAANGGVNYGDPWQLIYVFDGDSTTNVVCEGYAKAFQYLCDLSSWTDDTLQCYCVSGKMDGGNHMWNIVTLGGENYLVDVTNCDEGSVGYPNWLFMAAPDSGSANSGYTMYIPHRVSVVGNGISYNNEKSIRYQYDEESDVYWDASVLTLNDTSFNQDPYLRYADVPESLFVGEELSLTASVVNANGKEYSFEVLRGYQQLPAGLSLDPNTGVITGVLTNTGAASKVFIAATSTNDPGEVIYTFLDFPEIAQGTVKLAEIKTAPVEKILIYNGVEQALVTPGTANNGTMVYSLAELGTYTSEIPVATDADTYTVYYKAKGTGDYRDSATASVTVTISPKEVNDAVIELEYDTVMFDGAAKEPKVISVKDGETVIPASEYAVSYSSNVDVGTAVVEISDKQDGNYIVSGSKTFTITPVVYTVAFDANGGAVTQESAKTTEDGNLTELPVPTRKGYKFLGWYTAVSDGDQVSTDTVFEENTTIYARWEELDYEIIEGKQLTIWIGELPAGSHVLLVSYRADGRMEGSYIGTMNDDGDWEFPLTAKPEGAVVKLLIHDGKYAPVKTALMIK